MTVDPNIVNEVTLDRARLAKSSQNDYSCIVFLNNMHSIA